MDEILYKPAELAALLGVETGLLKSWAKEFEPFLAPLRTGPRARLYRPRDLEVFRAIKRLVEEEGCPLAEVGRRLEQAGPVAGPAGRKTEAELAELKALLAEIRTELLALRRLLTGPSRPAPPARAKRQGPPR